MAKKKLDWEKDDPEWELVGIILGDLYDGTTTKRGRQAYTYTYYETVDALPGTELQYRVCSQIDQQQNLKCDKTITKIV